MAYMYVVGRKAQIYIAKHYHIMYNANEITVEKDNW